MTKSVDESGKIDDLADFDKLISKFVYTQQHQREFSQTFSDTFLSWQKVEAKLYLLFAALNPNANMTLISAAFHSVVSLDARLAMITAVAQLQLAGHPTILAKWAPLYKRVRSISKKRNLLAHFSLHEHTSGNKVELRLRPSIFDSRGSTKDYGINEIRNFGNQFEALEEELLRLTGQIQRLGQQLPLQ